MVSLYIENDNFATPYRLYALLIMRLSIYIYTCIVAQIAYKKRGLLLLPYLRGALWTFIT